MAEREIGNYRILKQIGSGGMAKVYLAVHKNVPNLRVVLKILSNPQHAARFMQEADKLAQLDKNPKVCHIKDFFYHEDELVIAMEYIDGKSLEEMIADKGRFSVEETIAIITDLLAALESAHEKAIYHRDIKPSNIMFEKDGQLKVIDFGIAKGKYDPRMTIEGTATGTPEYMAPEQFEGGEHLDYAKCDIYAVGTMMYRMLTGELPFKAENQFILRDKKLTEDPAPPSRLNKEISGELARIVLKSIDKDPGKRFASIAEMKSELMRIAGSPERQPHGERRTGRKTVGVAVLVAVLAAAAVFTTMVVRGRDGNKESQPRAKDSGIIPRTVPAGAETARADTQSTATAARTVPVDTKTVYAEVSHAAPARVHKPPPAISPSPATGTLVVSSRPRARIYINGEDQNQLTTYTFDLPPGRYVVRLVADIGGKEVAYYDTVAVQSNKEKKMHHNF